MRCDGVSKCSCKKLASFREPLSVRFQTLLDFHPGLAHLITMSDDSEILAANAAFYAAFAAGDFAALAALWADRDGISCIHPGWPAIVGRAAVIGSWRDILANPGRPNIVCADPHAIVDGNHGHVLCIELVDGAALAAANHFTRVDGAWQMVHHQSSAIAQLVSANDDPDGHSLH
jgi:ketosteroid isomerase-like protein